MNTSSNLGRMEFQSVPDKGLSYFVEGILDMRLDAHDGKAVVHMNCDPQCFAFTRFNCSGIWSDTTSIGFSGDIANGVAVNNCGMCGRDYDIGVDGDFISVCIGDVAVESGGYANHGASSVMQEYVNGGVTCRVVWDDSCLRRSVLTEIHILIDTFGPNLSSLASLIDGVNGVEQSIEVLCDVRCAIGDLRDRVIDLISKCSPKCVDD